MVEPGLVPPPAASDPASRHDQDIVAELPDEVARYRSEHGELPVDLQFEPSVYCVWGKRTFIHTRATLPLQAVDDGVGFGLWVEVEPTEFQRYISAVTDDNLYGSFDTEGFLANSWPGFFQTIGLPVKVATVRMSEKVYITEVGLDRVRDVLFETALMTETTPEVRADILVLVQDWLEDGKQQIPQSEPAKPSEAGESAQPSGVTTSSVEPVPELAQPSELIAEPQFETYPQVESESAQQSELSLVDSEADQQVTQYPADQAIEAPTEETEFVQTDSPTAEPQVEQEVDQPAATHT
jgi:hypothetical protein